MSKFAQLVQHFIKEFAKKMGRGPRTAFEMMEIQNQAVRTLNNAPKIKKPEAPKSAFKGWTPRVIEGGKKPKKGIADLMESEEIIFGKAPKTKKSTLERKKDVLDKQISKEMWQKQKKAENKAAIERFKKMMDEENPKTVEDFRDEGDWDPSGFAYGGIAPLIGEPSYAADFYDDRTPYLKGKIVKGIKTLAKKKKPKIKKDRAATPDELEEYTEILDPTGEAYIVEEGMTVKQLDKMVKEHNAYMDDMYRQYKRGDLDKYVKPEVLEEQALRFQKNMDAGIDEAYEEIAGGSGFSGDYKYDADILTDSMEEVWKKNRGPSVEFTDKQRDVAYNMALKRVRENLKKPKVKDEYYSKKDMEKEWDYENDLLKKEVQQEDQMIDTALSGMDERQLLKQKYPGISDDLLDKILVDDNPQRKADVMATMDQYMKLRELGKSENEAYSIITESIKKPTTHAEGGRIGYAGGGKAGLPAITQGLPQGPNMQQPQMPAGPQPVGMPGGDLLVQNQMQQNPWMGQNPNMKQGLGGMPRAQMAGGGMGRRAFMKLMAAMSAAPFVGKGIQKAAPKMIKESAEVISKGPDGMPNYINDLIAVVKAKGTRESVPGMKQSDLGTKHTYKGVEVTEDPVGNIIIKKDIEGGGQYTDEFGEIDTWDGKVKEIQMEIKKDPEQPKASIYEEATARPDQDGSMDDVEFLIDDVDHLDLKKIADEINEEVIIKKASGGLAYALGE